MQPVGMQNVFFGNSELPPFSALGEEFDVVVAGEIIEHVLNPGAFLESIKTVCYEYSMLILTTVNCAPIKRIPRLLFKEETVHQNHVYYFSTLSRLLKQCDYQIDEYCTDWQDVGAISRGVNVIL